MVRMHEREQIPQTIVSKISKWPTDAKTLMERIDKRRSCQFAFKCGWRDEEKRGRKPRGGDYQSVPSREHSVRGENKLHP